MIRGLKVAFAFLLNSVFPHEQQELNTKIALELIGKNKKGSQRK